MTRSCELAGDAASKALMPRAEPRPTACDVSTTVPSRDRARKRRRLAASAAKVAASRGAECYESSSAIGQRCARMCTCHRCAPTCGCQRCARRCGRRTMRRKRSRALPTRVLWCRAVRLSVVMPYWLDRPPLEAVAIGATADQLGYDSLWIGEMMTFDAFALAGALARATARITLVVGPLPVGTRDPAALALGVASVSVLGGRPAHLALGASTPTVVERWHGRRWQPAVTRMRETVSAL